MNQARFKRLVEAAILSPQYNSKPYVNDYLKVHMKRFTETVALLQGIAEPGMRVIDVGSYGSLVPALKDILGIANIILTEPSQEDKPASEDTTLRDSQYGHKYAFHVDRFDVEGKFPYSDETFDLVIFTEVLEHLTRDPCQTLGEINRITKMKGWCLISTPNCASARSVIRILLGGNPNIYPVYNRHPSTDRHNHEYVPWEVRELMHAAGYTPTIFKTVDVYEDYQFTYLGVLFKAVLWFGSFVTLNLIKARGRGDTIFVLGRKTSGIQQRYPDFLYAPPKEDSKSE
jgi:SAM-dependent methyltransferase